MKLMTIQKNADNYFSNVNPFYNEINTRLIRSNLI